MCKATWSRPHSRAVWHLNETPYRVWAPEDKRTFVVLRRLGDDEASCLSHGFVTIKRGFRKLATAQAFAEGHAGL